MPTPSSPTAPFLCPLCGSDSYVAIHVRRPSGNWYRNPFYRCFGCAVMFENPVAFTRSKKLVRDPEAMGRALGKDQEEGAMRAIDPPLRSL